MSTVLIEVTQEDIDHGVPGDPCGCPIALAISRATGHYVVVGTLGYDDYRVCFDEGSLDGYLDVLPERAKAFASMFDADDHSLPVEPISFEIDLPAPLHTEEQP